MKRALVVVAEGFEEIEAVTPVDVLRRAGAEVTLAGLDSLETKGAHGVIYKADTLLEKAGTGFDMLILPGGLPGAKFLGESAALRGLAEKLLADGAKVAAICAAPVMTLGAWGLLDGRTATCYPGMESQFPKTVTFSPDTVVVDGQITTSRGPGTALAFGIALAEQLIGESVAAQLADGMLLRA